MSEAKDTRNWKCLFGMHQWVLIAVHDYTRSDEFGDVYMRGKKFIMQCAYCGKVKRKIL